jgi:hypothetical protein
VNPGVTWFDGDRVNEDQDGTGANGTAPSTQSLRNSWPALVAGVPSLLTLVALAFSLFPWLEPIPPPTVRRVTITDLTLGERNTKLDDGRTANSIYFDVEIVGYDAEDIAVDWLVFNAATRERLREPAHPVRWGVIDLGTRSDRIVGEIHVPPPADFNGCVFVRVLLRPYTAPAATPTAFEASPLLLDIADTAPFDPFDAANPSCPDGTPSVRGAT